MKINNLTFKYINWSVLLIYILLVLIGLISIYSVEYQQSIDKFTILNLSRRFIKQLFCFIVVILSFVIIFNIDSQIYQNFGYFLYFIIILALLGTFFLGVVKRGHSSWYKISNIHIQPTELAKLVSAFAISKYIGENRASLSKVRHILVFAMLTCLPAVIILLQGDLGSALIFSSYIIVGYREGFPIQGIIYGFIIILISILSLVFSKIYLIIYVLFYAVIQIGIRAKNIKNIVKIITQIIILISVIFSVELLMYKFLKPHHQNRIKALINPKKDPKGINWNTMQAKIAISSGKLFGKGFLNGLQTQYRFVPAQVTDFIFSNIAEEHGFIGACLVVILFCLLLTKILMIAERQRLIFARVYGYSLFAILIFHFMISIGMTLGLAPVIGIPLPFISYGPSALFSFSIMLLILLKMDVERLTYLSKRNKKRFL